MDLRTPKGTTDYPPKHALLYEEIINKTISVFKTYGALPIDTPIFELKEILLNKYGEDTKLIYDLKGEDCALRYDLTVPFSRFMAMNKLKKIKRYQIGKVFRRDQPSIVKGRLREFIQADFDIAGDGLPMVIESELLSCVNTLLEMYKISPFEINISDRRLLISILKMANVLKESIGTISSTIDKVDKLTKMELDKEFESKGLSQDQIETIHKYIKIKGREEVLEFLKKDPIYELEECKEAVFNMETLLRYSSIYGYKENLKINLSLARGLDYYTGLIMEATYKDSPVGSVLGGGRYDNLISGLIDSTSPSKDNKVEEGRKEEGIKEEGRKEEGRKEEGRKEEGRKEEPKLSKQGYKLDEPKSSKQIPCAGFSIGISRIFSLLVSRPLKESQTQVYVSSSGGLFLEVRMGILNILWKNKINAETFYTKRYNLKEHKEYCVKKGIKYLVVIGQVEVEKGNVSILNIEKDSKIEVSKEEMVEYILKDE